MRKNTQEVMEAWNNNEAAKPCRAIWTDGWHVYSYDTCIVAFPDEGSECNEPVVNVAKYSPTTTQHQRGAEQYLLDHGFDPVRLGEPSGVTERGISPHQLLKLASAQHSERR